ncbi:alanine aminotransferase 2-like [Gossypium australe]|uniref:Alanine aminotransferase 2-like n=1 Tax=Gossypium australe TaxID=47621 RepID=A0A5B6VD34_9ROSI|nr:alanine aminotransferase 2-like [Gossypium australe]
MYPLEKFVRFDLGTSKYEEKSRRLRLEYLRVALRHINEAVSDLFDQLDKRVTPIPAILVETFRFLNACWKAEKVSYRVFSENYSPLKEFVATSRQDNISEEKWMAILQSLQDKEVE